MSGSNQPFEPRLTPDEVYHGFIHPWDEQRSFKEPVKAFSPRERPPSKDTDEDQEDYVRKELL